MVTLGVGPGGYVSSYNVSILLNLGAFGAICEGDDV
eukprot:CAMPEP_0173114134 /NCGR_PEP_ID=MMETSP1102-20130122/47403_1 /TAXON_ID=49646 /ORGANISM="Geminigera sp., Strain Caron Lab Isolate" /LENGTH=35 /DNA_ID= /DNA_START= /DNA_END= /DNA_ORIENTATION=